MSGATRSLEAESVSEHVQQLSEGFESSGAHGFGASYDIRASCDDGAVGAEAEVVQEGDSDVTW